MFADINNVTINYQLLGAGEKIIVFNHGLVMDNLSSWYFTLGNRASIFARVLLYDLRGHGMSTRPQSGYKIADLVTDLQALLDVLEIKDRIFLVGNSFGGLLNLAYAIKCPETVRGIILVDSHIHDEGFAADMKYTLGLKGMQRDLMIAKQFKNWLGRHSERKRNKLAATASALVYQTRLLQDLQESPVFNAPDIMNIHAPVLAVYGEKSDIRQKGEQLAGILSDCDLRIIPGCTHSVLWEATDELCNVCIDWIQNH